MRMVKLIAEGLRVGVSVGECGWAWAADAE